MRTDFYKSGWVKPNLLEICTLPQTTNCGKMMKSYQRIAPSKLLGVISSGGNGRGGVCFDASGSLVLSSALQDINVFNVRMGQQVL